METAFFPFSGLKRWLLRSFGARIGVGVVIKPQVRVKYPWRLTVGSHSWIGQGVWIDNLANVRIGNHVCLSQDAYLCTGSHNYDSPGFDLVTRPIEVKDGAWVAARSLVLGGTSVGENAVVAAGSIVHKDVPPRSIVGGNPARFIKSREAHGQNAAQQFLDEPPAHSLSSENS